MAASSLDTSWTTLLQKVLRQKQSTAVVTPIFGRRYETMNATYTLENAETFTYWDGSSWQSLKNNLANFSDVDSVLFFLGANYNGSEWYTLYSAMVSKFLEWFPNATIFCCSSTYFAKATNDAAIQTVASEKGATYINMVGTTSSSKPGAYVYGDDEDLHQINNNAVANHYGDYGEYLIVDRISSGIGYINNITLLNITINAVEGATLSVKSSKSLSGAVISVFCEVSDGVTLSSINVTDEENNNITVTDHENTDYGRIFTFVMPSSNVTITAVIT